VLIGYDENHVESCDEEEEAEPVVYDKLEELNRMKARLSQLQSMVAAVSRGEIPHVCVILYLSCDQFNIVCVKF
jgi:hypothetical protein